MRARHGSYVAFCGVLSLTLGMLQPPNSAAAVCTGPSVAVLTSVAAAFDATDVVNKLTATCRFSAVVLIDIGSGSSTVGLEDADTAFVFTYSPPYDAVALGDTLANYVDSGHRLVIADWGFEQGGGLNAGILGRLNTGGYLPFTTSANTLSFDGPFGLVADIAGSPLIAGTSSFSGGTYSYRESVLLAPGAELVSHWNDTSFTPFEAVKGNVVGLNFYPASSTAAVGYWDASTPGATLMANALTASANTTALSEKAPGSVPKGTKATVSGRLSGGSTCPAAKTLEVVVGSIPTTIVTNGVGAYSLKVKIKRKTRVTLTYAGDADCSASSVSKVIRAA